MATTITTLAFSPLSPAWVKGRMRGALICGTFGAVWMFEAVFFGGIATPGCLTVVWVATVAAIAWPVMRLRSFRSIPYSAADRELGQRSQSLIGSIVGLSGCCALEWHSGLGTFINTH
jgi:hypothetical protein